MAFWQDLFCVIRVPMKVFSVNAPIAHINCLGINFPIAHTSVTHKNCFRIICVIISGRIVFICYNFGVDGSRPMVWRMPCPWANQRVFDAIGLEGRVQSIQALQT